MLHDEKLIKRRLNNPALWRQLDAISKGTFVNHLGRGHGRTAPAVNQFNGPEHGFRGPGYYSKSKGKP